MTNHLSNANALSSAGQQTRGASLTFPPGFLWGAATAAYQVEGAAHRGGRTDSIWDAFARIPGAVLDGHDGEIACDQYHRMVDDVDLMARLNLASYRFSTSWSRVRPDGGPLNPTGVDYYSRLVDQLLGAGLVPWLTLYHWDLPQALQEKGGWANRDTAFRFAEYALDMHEALGDRVGTWTTLNEPWCSAFLGYVAGTHAPGHQDPAEGLAAAHHLLLGHGLAVTELRARAPRATLGITLNLSVTDPFDPSQPGDVEAARRLDGQFNRVFLDPLLRGSYPVDVLGDVAHLGLLDHVEDGDLEIISARIDALGVNYYHGHAASLSPEPGLPDEPVPSARPTSSPFPAAGGAHHRRRGLPLTGIGWEVQAEGLTRLLVRLQEEYTGPAGVALYVTENGAAYPDVPDADGFVQDDERLDYYDQHLRALHKAVERGVDVRGYFAWSFLDNYEWAFGYHQRFGIVRVDYDTQVRTPKASALWYAQVARDNSVPARPQEASTS